MTGTRVSIDPTIVQPDWSLANCAGIDTELMFPARGESWRPARAVCAECEIRQGCLDYALAAGEKFGCWGGTSERERRRMRVARINREHAHGTRQRYKSGCCCDECRRANAAYMRRRRAS